MREPLEARESLSLDYTATKSISNPQKRWPVQTDTQGSLLISAVFCLDPSAQGCSPPHHHVSPPSRRVSVHIHTNLSYVLPTGLLTPSI